MAKNVGLISILTISKSHQKQKACLFILIENNARIKVTKAGKKCSF